MLILYLHNAQRYILWILMLQITHRDAVAFLVWICLFVCLSFTHNLFYFVFSICLSKIYSLYFCSKTNQTSISWNIGIYINQTKTLNYNYLWITKNPKTPPRTFVIWTSAMNTDVRMGNLYLLFFKLIFSGYPLEVFIISDGSVAPYLLDPNVEESIPVIPPEVETVNLTWEAGPDIVSSLPLPDKLNFCTLSHTSIINGDIAWRFSVMTKWTSADTVFIRWSSKGIMLIRNDCY